jgi:hypothetical protein
MDSALEYLLLGAHGLLRLRPIMLGDKFYHLLRSWRWYCLSSDGSPWEG